MQRPPPPFDPHRRAEHPAFAHAVGRARAPWWWIVRSSSAVAALIVASGCAASVEPDDPVEATVTLGVATSIYGGSPDDGDPALRGVVALRIGSEGRYELCSGTVVAPNLVLTARHCVAKKTTTSVACDEEGRSTNGAHVAGHEEPSSVAIFAGPSPELAAEPDAVGEAIVAPDTDELCDSDIAFVVLDRALDDVEPVAVRLSGGVTPGEIIRSVGYGKNDVQVPLGTRLRKDGVAILAMGKGISESDTPLGPHEFEVGRSICKGDSGGPAFSQATGALVGVVSRGGDCRNDFGHIYTTTAGWDDLFAEAFAVAGGAPIPEPSAPTPPAPAADATTTSAPFEVDRPRAESCTTSSVPARGSASAALALACAIALAWRRSPRP